MRNTEGRVISESTFFSKKPIPTNLRHTLWSTGLRPCAVFPFLLCCKLSQSYSTSGLLRSLQNVHIQSPLNRKKRLISADHKDFVIGSYNSHCTTLKTWIYKDRGHPTTFKVNTHQGHFSCPHIPLPNIPTYFKTTSSP